MPSKPPPHSRAMNPKPAAEHSQQQHGQRHGRGGFVGAAIFFLELAPEGDEVGPRHVEGAEEDGKHGEGEEDPVPILKHGQQDFVLAPETGEYRYSRQRQRANGEGEGCQGHNLGEAAHLADVRLIGAVHDAASTEE